MFWNLLTNHQPDFIIPGIWYKLISNFSRNSWCIYCALDIIIHMQQLPTSVAVLVLVLLLVLTSSIQGFIHAPSWLANSIFSCPHKGTRLGTSLLLIIELLVDFIKCPCK